VSKIRLAEVILISLSFLIPLYLLVRTPLDEMNMGWIIILVWMCTPWIVFYLLGRHIYKQFSPFFRKGWSISVIIGFIISHILYIDVLFITNPSTGGLALIAMPIYLFIGLLVVLGILFKLDSWINKSTS